MKIGVKGLICPSCNTEMDFTTFLLKSWSPWHLNCNECNAKLRFKKYRRAILFSAILLGVFLGVFLGPVGFFVYIQNYDSIFLYLLFALFTLILISLLAEVILYKLAKKYAFSLETR